MNKGFEIYGRNPVDEALRSGNLRSVVTCDRSLYDKYKGQIRTVLLKKNEFVKRYGTKTQGVIGQLRPFDFTDLDAFLKQSSGHSLILVLDHIEDPHNFGAIIRNAEVFGVDLIIIPENRSVGVTPVVVKTSAGAVNHIPISKVKNISRTLRKLKEKDYWIYGAEANGQESLYQCDFDRRCVIVMGSEGHGISRNVRDNIDFVLNIPMYGQVNSLNVSSSTAVFLSEYRRKIKKNPDKKN